MDGGVCKVFLESLGASEGNTTGFTVVLELAGGLDVGCFVVVTLKRRDLNGCGTFVAIVVGGRTC